MTTGHRLLPQHAALLTASAISPDVAAARGYRSIEHKSGLTERGFAASQARVPALLIPIHNVHGETVTYQMRADEPRIINGKPIKYETPRGSRTELDVPPASSPGLRDPNVPLWITEGPRKADAAASLGLCCIAVIGVWNWRGSNEVGGKTALADWESVALNDRTIYIVFDSDVMTKTGVYQALARLKGFLENRHAHVRLVYLPAGAGGAKTGLDDYLAAGHGVDALIALAASELRPGPGGDGTGPDDEVKSQAARLVMLAAETDLFHDPGGEPFATVQAGAARETLAVRSGAFRSWLRRRRWEKDHLPATASALADAVETLAARAEFGGESHPVALRLAEHDGALYLDLGSDAREVVEIRPDGWRVVVETPVRFRRSATMAALPVPLTGGSLDLLRPFVNVGDGDGWPLLVGALVAAFRVTGPYFALSLHGEQGSAKSTTARIFRALVNPSRSPLRAEPADANDLLIAARNNWIVALDNLSHLRPWLSDALCRLSTGGGLGKRQLYTDADEVVLDAQRPVILTGIAELATRGDLVDRAIVLEQPTIADTSRRSEAEFSAAFEAVRPLIMGALLDAIAAALANEATVRLERLPRMADPARWVTAAEPALGWRPGTFLAAYARNRHEADAVVLEASLLVGPLERLVEHGPWQGPAALLLANLAEKAGDDVARQRDWPKSAAGLTAALKRLAPSLRAMGLDWQRLQRSGSSRPHAIRKIDDSTVTTVTSVMSSPAAGDDPAFQSSMERHEVGSIVTPDRDPGDGGDGRDSSDPTLFGAATAPRAPDRGGESTDDGQATTWTG